MKTFSNPKIEDVTLAAAMQALADPCRLQIVRSLLAAGDQELACNEFSLEVSKATASHHFEALRCAGIIESRSEGTKCLSSLRRAELDRRFPGLLDLIRSETGTL